MKIHIVQPKQSLFDIAVIRYGDVAGIMSLLQDNPELKGPTDRIYVGQALQYREAAIDLRRKVYLEDYQTIGTIRNDDMPEGIGFWRLDEYVITGDIPNLAFVDQLLGYEADGQAFRIFFAINIEGVFTVTFTNENNEFVRDYEFHFFPNQQTSFSPFTPGTYNIIIGTVSSQITITA